jgi:hypothetical protein
LREERRQSRLTHAQFLVDIAADQDRVATYDLPPKAGLELQSQILHALSRSPFLAGAEITACRHKHDQPKRDPVTPQAPPAYGLLARLRARVLHEAADILDSCWHSSNSTPQQLLREFARAWSWRTSDDELRRHRHFNRNGASTSQLVELLAVSDVEELRLLALELVDRQVRATKEREEFANRVNEAEARLLVMGSERDRYLAWVLKLRGSIPASLPDD